MVAGHVVPLDPVSVEIVEDGETGLGEKYERYLVSLGQSHSPLGVEDSPQQPCCQAEAGQPPQCGTSGDCLRT